MVTFRVMVCRETWWLGYQIWGDTMFGRYFGLCVIPGLMLIFGWQRKRY